MIKPHTLFIEPNMHDNVHIMFDLETLDTRGTAIVTEISGVAFNILTGEILGEVTTHIDTEEQKWIYGRTTSKSTLEFWEKQPEDARNHMLRADPLHCAANDLPAPIGLRQAMGIIAYFIKTHGGEDPQVWGNGISFDLGKLESLFDAASVKVPWNFWSERDVRTLVALAPSIKAEFNKDFQGIPHYGLDDCKHQIRYVSAIYSKLFELSEKQ